MSTAPFRIMVRVAPVAAVAATAMLLMPAAPAEPSVAGTPLCQNYLSSAVASMQASQTRLQTLRGKQDGDVCGATRSYYLDVVKTRAVTALCKSGPDRTQDVGRLDATIEELDGLIASRCS
jgi:hypothetical protein